MKRVWVLAGTTEGRELCELLGSRGVPFLATVATAYGASLIGAQDSVRIGKLDRAAMHAMITAEEIAAAIDATHPYAVEASSNARAACEAAGIPYLRLSRAAAADGDGFVRVKSIAAAAAYLNEREGNALIATGGNGASEYTAVKGFEKRLFLRILPDSKVIERCEALGFGAGNIIAMRGPFSEELNLALLRATNARFLVTKDSGMAGGAQEKFAAAQKAGVTVLLVERPESETGNGVSVVEAADWAQEALTGLHSAQEKEPPANMDELQSMTAGPQDNHIDCAGNAAAKALFPLFVDLQGRQALVVGGGEVGARRANVLASFGAAVRIVAPAVGSRARELIDSGTAAWIPRGYQPGDCVGMAIVVAATDERATNAAVANEAKALGIPVSVADAPDEATFHFPAIVREGSAVLGLTTGDPAKTKRLAAKLRELLAKSHGCL